jgi:hypothetical protein
MEIKPSACCGFYGHVHGPDELSWQELAMCEGLRAGTPPFVLVSPYCQFSPGTFPIFPLPRNMILYQFFPTLVCE